MDLIWNFKSRRFLFSFLFSSFFCVIVVCACVCTWVACHVCVRVYRTTTDAILYFQILCPRTVRSFLLAIKSSKKKHPGYLISRISHRCSFSVCYQSLWSNMIITLNNERKKTGQCYTIVRPAVMKKNDKSDVRWSIASIN